MYAVCTGSVRGLYQKIGEGAGVRVAAVGYAKRLPTFGEICDFAVKKGYPGDGIALL